MIRAVPPPSRTSFRRRRSYVVALSVGALTVSLLPALSVSPASAAAGNVTVSPGRSAYLADEGQSVSVPVTVTVEGGGVLAHDVTVDIATGAGTATAGEDYTAVTGQLVFPQGTPSGGHQQVTVQIARSPGAETAETIPLTLTTSAAGATVGGGATITVNAHGFAYLDASLPVAQRVDDLVSRMTMAEKIGQMTQAERASVAADPSQIATLHLGSVLSGGGSTPAQNTPQAWADMVDTFQTQALSTRLQIPMIYGVDSVHGHGNLYGSTLFPHNVGMGATRDPALAEQEEHVTAQETRATGIPWVFAPCVCVARDERWGRSYESFGEDPALVTAMEPAIRGFQGNGSTDLASPDRVLATVKHFAGDGDTEYGSGDDPQAHGSNYPIDQGITVTNHADFARIDLAPYVPAVKRWNAGSIMPSYSSVDWTEDGVGNPINMHGDADLIQGWLKDQTGFDGFVISDYNGIDHIGGDFATNVRTSVNAGVDMFMQPSNYALFETTLMDAVQAGQVTTARIDDAVSRILTKKFQLGLFEKPFTDRAGMDRIGSASHRAVARRAAAESQVLLKNAGGVLPLSRNAKVYVAGRNADNLGNQAGGWTITWQGMSGTWTKGTTILQGMRQVAPKAQITYSADASAPMSGADVGVVVVGETPYSEGFGDVGGPQWAYDPSDNGQPREPKMLTLHADDQAAVDRVCGAISRCVVLVVSGRTQVVTDRLGEIDALVASWLPGTEGAGVADVLFGRRPFTGQLPVSWGRTAEQEPLNVGDASYAPLYPFGWGITTASARDQVRAAQAQARGARGSGGTVARAALREALADRNWNSDGSTRRERDVLVDLTVAAGGLTAAQGDTFAARSAVVSVVRNAIQARAGGGVNGVSAATAKRVALADQALLRGSPVRAIAILVGTRTGR